MNLLHRSHKQTQPQSPLTRQTSWHRLGREPHVDWVFMLLIGIVCVGILVVISVSTYMDTDNTLSQQGDTASVRAKPPINVEALSSTVRYFSVRATTRTALMKGTSVPPDPSL